MHKLSLTYLLIGVYSCLIFQTYCIKSIFQILQLNDQFQRLGLLLTSAAEDYHSTQNHDMYDMEHAKFYLHCLFHFISIANHSRYLALFSLPFPKPICNYNQFLSPHCFNIFLKTLFESKYFSAIFLAS